MLPVVLYLTLPTVILNQNSRKDTRRNTKSQKQKQRDQERMKQFNEQKTVCSQFPFYSLDTDGFRKMMSKSVSIQFSQTNLKSEKTKVRDLLEENDKMTLLTMDLKEDLKAVNENLKHTESEKSDIQCRLLEEQTKCAELETECSKLRYELCEEQRLHQEIKTELSEIKEETYNMVDEEVEHHRFIEKPQFLEVNEIKKEISQLKIKLLKYSSNTSQAEHVHSTTGNSTMKQANAQQGTGKEFYWRKSSVKPDLCWCQCSFRMSEMWKYSVSPTTTVSYKELILWKMLKERTSHIQLSDQSFRHSKQGEIVERCKRNWNKRKTVQKFTCHV